jgi:hypothetical protein
MDEDFRGVSPTSVRDTLDEGPGWRVQQNGAILLVKSNKWDLVSLGSDPVQVKPISGDTYMAPFNWSKLKNWPQRGSSWFGELRVSLGPRLVFFIIFGGAAFH